MPNLKAKKLPFIGHFVITIVLSAILAAAILNMVDQYADIRKDGRVNRMNRFKPRFVYLLKAVTNQIEAEPKEIIRFIKYYELVLKNFPDQVGAYDYLGLCYYFIGDEDRAISNYQKALKWMPNSFWSAYNLGLIHYKNERYDEAAGYLKKALEIKLIDAFKVVRFSKVNLQVGHIINATDEQLSTEITRGTYRALFYLGHCMKRLGDEEFSVRILDKSRNYLRANHIKLSEKDPIELRIF